VSLVPVADLRAYLREDGATDAGLQAALEAAEAAVAAYIGAPTLAERAVTEVHRLPRAKTLVEVRDGPLTALSKALLDGEEITAELQTSFWAVARYESLPEGAELELQFTAGWTSVNLPAQVKQAVLMAAASIYARPDAGVARLGSPDGSWTGYHRSYLSPDVRKMLEPYRRPSWT